MLVTTPRGLLFPMPGSCSRVVFRRKSGDLVEVVVTLRCVKGICIFMCVEVHLGPPEMAELRWLSGVGRGGSGAYGAFKLVDGGVKGGGRPATEIGALASYQINPKLLIWVKSGDVNLKSWTNAASLFRT